jgi:hypothetical protein
LSALFATLLSFVSLAETFIEPLRVVPGRPAPVTLRLPPTLVRERDEGGYEIRMREITVTRGSTVSDPGMSPIVRRYEAARRPPSVPRILGVWFVFFLTASMIIAYLRVFTPGRGALLRTQAGLMGLALVLLVGFKALLLFTSIPVFALPVACVPLWASFFLDRRTAITIGVAMSFATGALIDFRMSAIVVYLVSCATAVATFRDRKHSWQMLVSGAFAGGASAITVVAALAVLEGGIDLVDDLMLFTESRILGAAAGGVGAGVLAFLLQPVAVSALGAVSRSKLVDLSDLGHPLLQRMAAQAPGSWEHARAMANLAEAAAAAIHADSLLTRIGAYYHDLGKTVQPKYFVENLEEGEQSPHNNLPPDVSADAIMAHVVEGVNILRRGGLPEPVVEFAYTHHGTSVIEYFWHKCLEQGNPKNLDENAFRYPGMRPRTKETAILMLIDSIEAASRTIDPPTIEKFEEMVSRIVFVKLKQGQLDESGLTIDDLRVITARIAETLTKSHHKRIKYPWQARSERGQAQLPVPGSATEEDVARAREEAGDGRDKSAEPPTIEDDKR